MEKIALFREGSIWHPAWLGKFGVSMNFRQYLGVICAKNMCESGISRVPWGPLKKYILGSIVCFALFHWWLIILKKYVFLFRKIADRCGRFLSWFVKLFVQYYFYNSYPFCTQPIVCLVAEESFHWLCDTWGKPHEPKGCSLQAGLLNFQKEYDFLKSYLSDPWIPS